METLQLVDEIKAQISDGVYLALMNALKKDYDTTQKLLKKKEKTIKELKKVIKKPSNEKISKRSKGQTIMGELISKTRIRWEDGSVTRHTARSLKMLRVNHAKRF